MIQQIEHAGAEPKPATADGAVVDPPVAPGLPILGAARAMELSTPMYMAAGEGATISFANIPAGTYPFNCTPHLAMNMKGTITVQ